MFVSRNLTYDIATYNNFSTSLIVVILTAALKCYNSKRMCIPTDIWGFTLAEIYNECLRCTINKDVRSEVAPNQKCYTLPAKTSVAHEILHIQLTRIEDRNERNRSIKSIKSQCISDVHIMKSPVLHVSGPTVCVGNWHLKLSWRVSY